jgi:hypothetical protein
MAEWLLSRAIAERDEASGEKPRKREADGGARK